MALREREVTGYLVDGDGSPIELAFIKFKPTSPMGYTSSHIIVDREFTAQTDDNGHFSSTLWCDEDSLVAINYNVTFPVVNNGQPDAQHIASFSLEYGDGTPINLATVINASVPAPTPEELLYTLIEQMIAESGGGGAWGSITGTLSDQTDLNDALAAKAEKAIDAGTESFVPFFDADGNLDEDSDFKWSNTSKRLLLGDGASKGIQFGSLINSFGGRFWRDGDSILLGLSNSAGAFYLLDPTGDGLLTVVGDGRTRFGIGAGGISQTASHFFYGISGRDSAMLAQSQNAAQRGIDIQLAAAQTADAFQILPFGSSTPKMKIDKDGFIYGDSTNVKLILSNAAGSFLYYGSTYIGIGGSVINFMLPSGAGALWADGGFYPTSASSDLGLDASRWRNIRLKQFISLNTPITDAVAENNSIFLGSDHSNTLCFKDSGGTVKEFALV